MICGVPNVLTLYTPLLMLYSFLITQFKNKFRMMIILQKLEWDYQN